MSNLSVTIYGVCALSIMRSMYGLERHGHRFILAAAGCLPSSAYGILSGAWPLGVVEIICSGIAVQRYRTLGSG